MNPLVGLVDPGLTIPDFLARPSFSALHHLPTWPPLIDALQRIFRGKPFRFCAHNDIGINRIVGWHKDRLNDAYRPYQKLPLWSAGNHGDGGHKIVKVGIYLQDHTHDDSALLIVPRSYTDPRLDGTGARRLHPRKGSVVIFEQRSTHRGLTIGEGLLHTYFGDGRDRILISLGYGLSNAWTREFEAGTAARQKKQCGARCPADFASAEVVEFAPRKSAGREKGAKGGAGAAHRTVEQTAPPPSGEPAWPGPASPAPWPHSMHCAYAMVPSRGWFVGMLSLLHSLSNNADKSDTDCGYALVGHPTIDDSRLTPAQRAMVDAVTRGRRVHWLTANVDRLAKWRAIPNLRDGAIMSLLKLELFYDAGPICR